MFYKHVPEQSAYFVKKIKKMLIFLIFLIVFIILVFTIKIDAKQKFWGYLF